VFAMEKEILLLIINGNGDKILKAGNSKDKY
jgi:hypothetical protein